MSYPTTPQSILVRLKKEENPGVWNKSWEEFFDLYHEAIRITVGYAFGKYPWYHVNEDDFEGTVLRVFQSFHEEVKAGFEADADRGKLRQFLATLCHRRVADFMRQQKRRSDKISVGDEAELDRADKELSIEKHQLEVFIKPELNELVETLRGEISPRVFMIFELVKLNGEDPEAVARHLEIKRGVVDNSVYKAMQTLREIHDKMESNR